MKIFTKINKEDETESRIVVDPKLLPLNVFPDTHSKNVDYIYEKLLS